LDDGVRHQSVPNGCLTPADQSGSA
jgi:hypothetical protein